MPSRRPKKTRHQSRTAETPPGERLQKVLAAAGLGSRRKCEELIVQGRVEIDRQVAKLGDRVETMTQEVRVDGEIIRPQRSVYFMVNKPPGVLSTNYDPEYRVRVVDLVKASERLFTIGRLDQYSEGLIVVTNDGELANRLTHPRYGATKTYHVVVAGAVERQTLERLERGVHLAEGVARVASLKIKKLHPQSTELEMVLEEGKNREVRRVFAAVGHKVLKLKRVQIGTLKLGELPLGAHRQLTRDELEKLLAYAHERRKKDKVKHKPRPAKERAAEDYDNEPLIDESDDALPGELTISGPVLASSENLFDSGIRGDPFRPAKPGAVIAFDDDDAAPARPAPRDGGRGGQRERAGRGEKPRGKFAKKKAFRSGSGGGKKPGAGAPKKFARAGDKTRPGGSGSGGKPPPGASGGKFKKKPARRKGRP